MLWLKFLWDLVTKFKEEVEKDTVEGDIASEENTSEDV